MQLGNISKALNSRKFLTICYALFLLITFSFFLDSALSFIDPDFGWHLRFGKLIATNGIPFTDPFSYSMPSYKFVNHEWLTDRILSSVYRPETGTFIASIFVFITILAFFLQFSLLPLTKWTFLLYFCTLFSIKMFVGIRPQVISWLFFSFIWYLIYNEKRWQRWRLLVPFVFLLWGNLHGGFPMGIALLIVQSIAQFWKIKRIPIADSLITLLSIGATFINPYGVFLWAEIFVSVLDPSLRWTVQEWLPAPMTAHLILWLYVTCSAVLVFLYRKNLSYVSLFVYIFYLFAGLSSIRHIPPQKFL
jgi:hypothetical protein